MKDDLVSYLMIPENKVQVIYNPVSQNLACCVQSNRLSDVEKKEYLLCVGRLEDQKAFHFAISAFATVASDYPSLRLRIVGQGSLDRQLKEQARMLGVTDRIDFEGYQANIISYYLYAKATVLTSLYEGFPNVLLESITLGTPVVAFDCPSGPSEIVVNGVNGFLVQHKDEAALAGAICKVLDQGLPRDQVLKTAELFRLDLILEQYE